MVSLSLSLTRLEEENESNERQIKDKSSKIQCIRSPVSVDVGVSCHKQSLFSAHFQWLYENETPFVSNPDLHESQRGFFRSFGRER